MYNYLLAQRILGNENEKFFFVSGGVLVGTEPRSPKTWKLKVTHHIKGIERKKWNTLQNIHGVQTLIKLLIVDNAIPITVLMAFSKDKKF